MKYIGAIITTYIVLFVLDIMQRRNHKQTQSLKKFTVRTITDVSIVCAVGAIFVIGAMVFALIDEPEIFKKNTFIMIIVVALLGLMFLGMIAHTSRLASMSSPSRSLGSGSGGWRTRSRRGRRPRRWHQISA